MVGNLSPNTVWAYDAELSLGNPNLEFIRQFRENTAPSVLMGHFSYGVHRILRLQPQYITVLRNPVERVISLYRYQKQLPQSAFAEYFRQGLSLYDFVGRGITEMTNNHACRVIAGIAPDAGMVIHERWLLELALHNLQRHYLLVGTLENIDHFILALGELLNWQSMEFPRENVTHGEQFELDQLTRDCIIKNNQLDIELYEYVLARYSRQGRKI